MRNEEAGGTMKNNRRYQKVTRRKKRLRNRLVRHWWVYLILMVAVVMVGFLLCKSGKQPSDIIEEEIPSNEITQQNPPYYKQEAGMIESILTETDEMVYSVHYPKFSQTEIDQDINNLVKEMISKAETAGIPVQSPEERGMLYINYDSYLVGKNVVSIIFDIELSLSNLANPETVMISKHYNLDTGEILEDEDLFKDGYLDAIAAYCQNYFLNTDDMKDMVDSEWYAESFGATKENYQNLSLTSDGILVTFSKDQILSASKEYQINIPYASMEEYLNFDYESETIVIEQKEESVIYETEEPVIDPNKPMIALTFDDGPSSSATNRILDVLLENHSRATFFVVGNRLHNYPEVLQRIVSERSEIGSHTYNHKSLSLLKASEIGEELSAVDDYLVELLGQEAVTLRPPYGAVNDLMKKTIDKPMINWSVDTEDWKNRDTKTIVNNVLGKVKDGDIVLFHDLYDTTAAAIEIIVPELIKEGYQIVTVSELFEAKGITLEGGKVYYNAR